jgi:hypothetical protein
MGNGRDGAVTCALSPLDAHENEPTCAQSSGPTECAAMICCNMGGKDASCNAIRSDPAGFFILLQVPFFWFDPRREHSSIPPAKSCSRRVQGGV